MRDLETLSDAHEKNVYSQCGEDGVIEMVCSMLGIDQGTAVELGASDGIKFSNTARLRERGWEACLIEGAPDRYASLVARFGNDPRVVCVKAWVEPTGERSLDAILSRYFPKPIDFLSIDIDGDDYHLFSNLKSRPRLVVIEFNPTIPPTVDRVNPEGTRKGSSLSALSRLAGSKGYELIHATHLNAFFLDAARNGRIRSKTPLEAFRWNEVGFVVRDYDGENWFAIDGQCTRKIANPWDELRAAHLVSYPKFLLGYGRESATARSRYWRFVRPFDVISPLLRFFVQVRDKMRRRRARRRDE